MADLLAGKRDFEGRSPIAIKRKFEDECGKLKRAGKPTPTWNPGPWSHYRPEEIRAIHEGREVPGRSPVAVQKKRLRLDPMRIWTPRPKWTPEQTERLLRDPRAPIAGRSLLARRHRLWHLGLTYRGDYPALTIQARDVKGEFRSGSVLVTASDRSCGYDLLLAISRALPSNLPDQVKAEAIGEAAIIHLEQGISPEAAAKEALRRARAFNNISFRFGEYNNALHDRGLWG